jgi:hypothetical protein
MTISDETAVPGLVRTPIPYLAIAPLGKSTPRADRPISGESDVNKPMPPVVHYLSNGLSLVHRHMRTTFASTHCFTDSDQKR